VGDPGSGCWLGQQALKTASCEIDGRGKPTSLTPAIANHLGLGSILEIKEKLYRNSQEAIQLMAALAPVVIAEAENGDEAAGEIIREGCWELARMALAVARKLDWETGPVSISAIGGVARSGRFFASALETALAASLPEANFKQPLLPPVLGASLLALQTIYEVSGIMRISQSKTSGLW